MSLEAAAIGDGDEFGAEPLRLHRGVDRRHAAADHHDAAADRQLGQILGLPQLGDEGDGVDDVRERLLAGQPELVDAGQADRRGTPRRSRARSSPSVMSRPSATPVLHLDPADRRG